jgi:hypothetical protein
MPSTVFVKWKGQIESAIELNDASMKSAGI